LFQFIIDKLKQQYPDTSTHDVCDLYIKFIIFMQEHNSRVNAITEKCKIDPEANQRVSNLITIIE
jgi:hypothetical protein